MNELQNEVLLKDCKEIRHVSNTEKALEELARILREMPTEESEKTKYLREYFLNGRMSDKPSQPNHSACTKCDSTRSTEKRICRCMKYYGVNEDVCKSCKLEQRWNNIGSIKVVDYEVPMKHAYDQVGGMDLILQTTDGKYAVEIKPPKGNKESIPRMLAEILTYTIEPDVDDNYYRPAIGLFDVKDNCQMKQFKKIKDNPDLKYIMEFIKVFIIDTVEKGEIIEYSIREYQG